VSPLLLQFLAETRECLERIASQLLALESNPDDEGRINELFRLVHTLKGNAGLFEFRHLTRVLHAGEDLLDAVRERRVGFSAEMADRLFDCMDLVAQLTDGIEQHGVEPDIYEGRAVELAAELRAFLAKAVDTGSLGAADGGVGSTVANRSAPVAGSAGLPPTLREALARTSDSERLDAWYRVTSGSATLLRVRYEPEAECFYKGEDPFHQILQTPDLLALGASSRDAWPAPEALDAYRCVLCFDALTLATRQDLDELFRYVPEQITCVEESPLVLVFPEDSSDVSADLLDRAAAALAAHDLPGLRACIASLDSAPGGRSAGVWLAALVDERRTFDPAVVRVFLEALRAGRLPDWSATREVLDVPGAVVAGVERPLAAPDLALWEEIWGTQRDILDLPPDPATWAGRAAGVASTLEGLLASRWASDPADAVREALTPAIEKQDPAPLRELMDARTAPEGGARTPGATPVTAAPLGPVVPLPTSSATAAEQKYGRRAEDFAPDRGVAVLKVAQEKVDQLMDLIGELVVAKNSLPYLAVRAENDFGVRELARLIKNQYAVINRIAEEMQDAIMQVRMLPVGTILQRFPRLVRDLSRKLGKQVDLVMEGEDTECDKNIIEALADPLVHVLRNSLDHGLETPEERVAAGKPAMGTIRIRAFQEADRVILEVSDDGRGVDPAVVKRKAFEKGLIDEEKLEGLSDADAVQLIFLPGFSTAAEISDVSGRGVGMDAVRSAVGKVNGEVHFHSDKGSGTVMRITLPLSMAVTTVMMVETRGQSFGVPMDLVVETVRVAASDVRGFKRQKTVSLRGHVVPLLDLNHLLGIPEEQARNDDGELAVLVVRLQGGNVGLVVDDFHETLDIILKPLDGPLASLRGYSGTALLGNGAVLMVLDPKELV
jgi:two-component system, chemotaxis family, sensor kinase CheA